MHRSRVVHFFNVFFDVFTKCESENLLEYLLNNHEYTFTYWVNPLLNRVKEVTIADWREVLEKKSSLTYYASLKETIALENDLDKNRF